VKLLPIFILYTKDKKLIVNMIIHLLRFTKVTFINYNTWSYNTHLQFFSLFRRLADHVFVDVRDHTSTRNGTLDEGIQLFVSTDGPLKIARSDTLHLQTLFPGSPRTSEYTATVASTRPFARDLCLN
jgi:hypothetical protein